jgi:hypothetical protein
MQTQISVGNNEGKSEGNKANNVKGALKISERSNLDLTGSG